MSEHRGGATRGVRGGYPSSMRLAATLPPPPAGPKVAAVSDMERRWWLCPNRECEHGNILHDIEDLGDERDERPTCCVDGCPCGGQR